MHEQSKPNHLKMQTPDITEQNIKQIEKLFPQVITESKDETGKAKKAVDFDLLKQCLSDVLVEDENERYRLDWPGKKAALLKANTPITKTLRPCREESVNFDTTENLYIEGDNFEVLKILQESYLGRIKMIYIDPPYNTGNDFIYRDNFKVSKEVYEDEIGAVDEDGGKLFKNTDSNGRFHSDWLSMMYERLVVARDLLRDDGVIFISIDDNEVHNLRKICDEVFGEGNFLIDFIWKKRTGSNDSQNMTSLDHDHVMVFSKSGAVVLSGIEKDASNYKNPDNDPRGPWAKDNLTCNKTASDRPNLYYPIIDPETGITYQCNPNRVWAYEKSRMNKIIAEKKIIFPEKPSGSPMYKRHLSELRSNKKPISSVLETKLNTVATKETRNLLGGQYFDYPKGLHLIISLVKQGSTECDDIILDFFSGSATTAHAVMQLNAKDGGKRKFIMVQLPEKTDEKSEAYKAGFKTISDIGKERIRRAGKKILEEMEPRKARKNTENENMELFESSSVSSVSSVVKNLDIGFRVYKTDTSNMKDVYYHPEELGQQSLPGLESNIKDDRSPEDLLTQVILDLGLELNLPIEKKEILGNTVFIVQTNALVACFDNKINFKIVDEIADLKPFKAVFKDASFKDDKDRINIEERFKRLSPETVINVI